MRHPQDTCTYVGYRCVPPSPPPSPASLFLVEGVAVLDALGTYGDILLREEDEVEKWLFLQVLASSDQLPLVIQGLHYTKLGARLKNNNKYLYSLNFQTLCRVVRVCVVYVCACVHMHIHTSRCVAVCVQMKESHSIPYYSVRSRVPHPPPSPCKHADQHVVPSPLHLRSQPPNTTPLVSTPQHYTSGLNSPTLHLWSQPSQHYTSGLNSPTLHLWSQLPNITPLVSTPQHYTSGLNSPTLHLWSQPSQHYTSGLNSPTLHLWSQLPNITPLVSTP